MRAASTFPPARIRLPGPGARPRPGAWLLASGLLIAGRGALAQEPPAGAAAAPDAFAAVVKPVLEKHCTGCHGGTRKRAGLALDVYPDEASAIEDRKIWEKVLVMLRMRKMPPENREQPAEAERLAVISWIDADLAKFDCTREVDPGRITIRRLNRAEYNNTIRDLLGVTVRPADDFPADDVGHGFDNMGDVLTLPPILLERYLAAAEKIAAEVMSTPELRARVLEPRPERPPPGYSRLEAARRSIERLATRAFRRPVAAEEVQRLLGFLEIAQSEGGRMDSGIELVIQALLVSPHFLFRVERDPVASAGAAAGLIGEWELAARLSYFIWSSMPDEELFEHARSGTLRANIEEQVRRMLADPKSQALTDNFAAQWLEIRGLKSAAPDPGVYPSFDDELRAAMEEETRLFFEAVMREDRSILDFIDGDFTFLNERLARHYGIPLEVPAGGGIAGKDFRRVSLPADGPRGGILTHASVLTATSNPTRTSPVKRGKWILEEILGAPPPPPPPDVPELKEGDGGELTGTLRQRMEQHRANPNCAVCHERMDALGFGFENFDGVGAWRTREGKFTIDASGTLPGGRSFSGPAELRRILLEEKDAFCRCFIEKMLTYALGRGLEYYDKCAVEQVSEALVRDGYRFSTLVRGIVNTAPFQMRRVQGVE